jgi:hypothetical protein
VGALAGSVAGYGLVTLGWYGVEHSEFLGLVAPIVLGPLIFLLSLPWSYLVPNHTGNAVTLFGLALGIIVNSTIFGAVIGPRVPALTLHFRRRASRRYGIFRPDGVRLSLSEASAAISTFGREECNDLLRSFGERESSNDESLDALRNRCLDVLRASRAYAE